MSLKSSKKIPLKVKNEGKAQSYNRIREAYILLVQYIQTLSDDRAMGKGSINPIGNAFL
jgi:hypothetical protein